MSAKQSGVFAYASGLSAGSLDEGSGQDRRRLKLLEERLAAALQRRLEAAGGDQAVPAKMEWRAASKAVWKERKKLARQKEPKRLDREAAAEAWTWKRDS